MGGVLVVQAGTPGAIDNKFNICLKHSTLQQSVEKLEADSHTPCRAHAVPLPCSAAKGLECVFHI